MVRFEGKFNKYDFKFLIRETAKMVRNTYVSGRQMQGDGGWAQNTIQEFPVNEDTGEAVPPLEVRRKSRNFFFIKHFFFFAVY